MKYRIIGHRFQKVGFVFTETLISGTEFCTNQYSIFDNKFPFYICTIIYSTINTITGNFG